MIMWRCVMATGGRLPYWVSNCFILIAFFFVLLKLIVEGKMNKNPNTIKKKTQQNFLYLKGTCVQAEYWSLVLETSACYICTK